MKTNDTIPTYIKPPFTMTSANSFTSYDSYISSNINNAQRLSKRNLEFDDQNYWKGNIVGNFTRGV